MLSCNCIFYSFIYAYKIGLSPNVQVLKCYISTRVQNYYFELRGFFGAKYLQCTSKYVEVKYCVI